jgi:class 3 adenylate cyclase
MKYASQPAPKVASQRLEGRFGYAAIGTVANVASPLGDEAKRWASAGQILISPRVLTAVEDAVTVEPVGESSLPGAAVNRQMRT